MPFDCTLKRKIVLKKKTRIDVLEEGILSAIVTQSPNSQYLFVNNLDVAVV